MGANAQTSVPAFTAGQVLTAAQVTQINTGIPVFASSTERDAAFGGTGEKTLAEGQMAYLEDTNATQYYDGSSWAAVAGGKILQIVSTAKTDTFSASVASGADSAATVSVTITPTSATSKVFIIADLAVTSQNANVGATLYRGGSAVTAATGDAASSRTRATAGMAPLNGERSSFNTTFTFLDSPATTSVTTYDARLWHDSVSTQTLYMNRGYTDADASYTHRSISTLTAIEVSA